MTKNVTGGRPAGRIHVPSFFCDFRAFLQSIEFDYGRTDKARAMNFFWGCGVIIFDAEKFERRSFRLAAKIQFLSKLFFLISGCFDVLRTCFWP